MLEGKKGLVFGVANQRSIAWAITKSLSKAGAELAITCQDEKFAKKLDKLVQAELEESPHILMCDVQKDEDIQEVYNKVGSTLGELDFLVHSIAYASKEDLEGNFVDTSREGFKLAMEISVYSLLAVVRPALPLMKEGSSIITMTYLGGQKVVPNYNVMGVAKAALESSVRYLAYELGEKGIRVNALSPGPVQTLSSRGIKGFSNFQDYFQEKSPMKRNIETEEIGDTAVFMCSHLSRGINGEVIFVDTGYHITGL